MSEDTVASLGFEVRSQQLDDAKQKLKDLSTEAGNTSQTVDKFNQSAAKTSDALGKVAHPRLRAAPGEPKDQPQAQNDGSS